MSHDPRKGWKLMKLRYSVVRAKRVVAMMVLSDQAKHTLIIFLFIAFWPNDSVEQNVEELEVTIPQGTLRGTTRTTRGNRTTFAFLGIPYAQPPIGNLRFANPVAAGSWTGTLNASIDGNMCSQRVDGIAVGAEDCLKINVYTPQLPENSRSTLLPVMVWFHGGRFAVGSYTSDLYGPEYLLDSDIVLVVPGYRLGPFGFLSTGDEVASGNWGLKDMVLALEWVQNNIEYFGGDPNQVTLFGHSAGAASIQILTLSDATAGLFHRYIAQSGFALNTLVYQPRDLYASRAFELGGYVGCSNDTSASLISCLRDTNVFDILAADPQFYIWESVPVLIWSPTDEPDVEGALLTDSPANIYAAGRIRDLPWMGGVVRDDGLAVTEEFYTDEELFTEFLDKFDALLPEILFLKHPSNFGAGWVEAIKSYYFNDDLTTNKTELLANLTVAINDLLFFYPLHNALEKHRALGVNSPQYFYTFNYVGHLSTGSPVDHLVGHGAENWYLYPSSSVSSSSPMIDTMVELWTSFAINGTPTTTANNNTVTWTAYSTELDNYLRIGNDSDVGLEVQYSFFKERMQFCRTLYSGLYSSMTRTSGAITTRPHLFFTLLLLSSKFISSLYSM